MEDKHLSDVEEQNQECVLFVDDETNILSSLRRLFRPLGYKIFTASSGQEGLEILENNEIDLIISDMRMPEMDGAEFLALAAKKWPDTIRILLTGYADMTSTIAAINEGKIYQYVSKPWEDNDIKLSVQYALKQKALEKERDQLLELTRKQNAELQDLNANLEDKVRIRTRELRQTMASLETTHKELKKSYFSSIKVFSNIIEMRVSRMAGHSRRVAEQARILAIKAGMNDDEVQQVVFAGLLHNIGKLGLSDNLIDKPFNALSSEDRTHVTKHPIVGEGILMELDYLQDAARLIRSQHEYFNGEGYPDRLSGEDIPLGARIIGLVSDYDALQIGILNTTRLSTAEALEFIRRNRNTRYDPKLVDLLLEGFGSNELEEYKQKSLYVKSSRLRSGMVLTRDLVLKTGVVLLTKGHLLNDNIIHRIRDLEKSMGEEFDIYTANKHG